MKEAKAAKPINDERGTYVNQVNVLIQVICVILATSILVYLFVSGRRTRTTYSYMACIALMLLWNFFEIFIILSQNSKQEMLALKLKFIPVVYLGACWFNFCLNITNSKLADSKALKMVLIHFPAICYSFLLTNEWHGLFFTEIIFKTKISRGIIFWIHAAESYFLIFSGMACLFMYMRKKAGKSLKYIMLLLLAVMIPVIGDILTMINIIPCRSTDISSQVLMLTFILFGIAVYQKKFLNLYPVAARHFIETMTDGIIIMDRDNCVVGINEAVNNLLPGLDLKMYETEQKIIDYLRENSEKGYPKAFFMKDKGGLMPEKSRIKMHDKVFNIEIKALSGICQIPSGKMIILEDFTEEQQLLDEIRKKNLLLVKANKRLTKSNYMLMDANKRLEKLSNTIEELAIMKERNRVGREVHDTVGHMLTLLIALAENAKLGLTEDQTNIKETLDKSIELSRQALNDIRNCLNDICKEPFEKVSLVDLMNHLVKANHTSGTRVEVSISEDLKELCAERMMAIYRICQESITNAIRHGNAKTVNIIIKNQANSVRLYIFDDGAGCSKIVKGYGLTGMEERVAKLGGKISFGSDGENGFNIIAELPVC